MVKWVFTGKKRRRSRDLTLLFIGSHMIIFTNLFVPRNLRTVRFIGFLLGTVVLLVFLVMLLRRKTGRRSDR